MRKIEFKRRCRSIKLLLFDCDGVLTDGGIVLGNQDAEMKFFSTKDGMGIHLWHKAGLLCGCITGRRSESLEKRAKELEFEEVHQNVSNKKEILRNILNRRNFSREQVAFIGDDVNDLPLLGNVSVFFAPADAHPEVSNRADFVLKARGGHGAVREAIDNILSNKNLMEDLIAAYLE